MLTQLKRFLFAMICSASWFYQAVANCPVNPLLCIFWNLLRPLWFSIMRMSNQGGLFGGFPAFLFFFSATPLIYKHVLKLSLFPQLKTLSHLWWPRVETELTFSFLSATPLGCEGCLLHILHKTTAAGREKTPARPSISAAKPLKPATSASTSFADI